VNLHRSYTGNIYLASDFHLGIDAKDSSKERELKIVDWLTSIEAKADLIILLGDIFDYWFEYKTVIPRGFSHFWAKIRTLRDAEIPIIFFSGNHDMWMFEYSEKEYGIPILSEPTLFEFNGKKVLLHHGDGLGPGEHGYKFIKSIFRNKLAQFLFARLHPNFGIWLMRKFSHTSRAMDTEQEFNASNEMLVIYCESQIQKNDYDFLIFGHRHLKIDHTLSNGKSRYINLGDWLWNYSYASFTDEGFKLSHYE